MAIIKPKRSSVASNVPTTSDLEVGEIALNMADSLLYFRDASDNIKSIGSTELDAISQSLLPDTTETYDLGSSSKRWRDLYLAGSTINLAGALISSDGTGTISISANGAILPNNSKIDIGDSDTIGIALQGESGEVVRRVPFYTKSGGLSTQNTTLNFRADTSRTIASFTLSDGSTLEQASTTLFLF